jgi:hypothetical protein
MDINIKFDIDKNSNSINVKCDDTRSLLASFEFLSAEGFISDLFGNKEEVSEKEIKKIEEID